MAPEVYDEYADVADLFAALSSPLRCAIVHLLADRGRTVSELCDELGVAQPLVSQHLRVLRGARLAASTRQGRGSTYTLTDEHVAHVFLDAYHHMKEADHS